jgi:hypothetical protein
VRSAAIQIEHAIGYGSGLRGEAGGRCEKED